MGQTKEKIHCQVCGREISQDDYNRYDGMCWECWDDQLTEETDTSYCSEDDFEPL